MMYDTIIIGGGLAGLSAAYFFGKKKYRILVLEKEKFVGGRSSSIYRNGFILDRGAEYIVHAGPALSMVLKGLKMRRQLVKITKRILVKSQNLLIDSTTTTGLVNFLFSKKVTIRNKVGLLLFFLKSLLALKEIEKSYRNFASITPLTGRAFLKRFFDIKFIDDFFEPLSKTFLFTSLNKINAGLLLVIIGSFIKPTQSVYYLKHGPGSISLALAKQIKKKQKIITNKEVKAIRKKRENFIVECKDGAKFFSKSVIFAAPVPLLRDIIDNKNQKKIPHLNIKYLPIIRVCVLLKRPLPELSEHFILLNDKNNFPLVFVGEMTKKNRWVAPRGRGLIYALVSPTHIEKIFSLNEKQIAEVVDRALSGLSSRYREEKIKHVVFKWQMAFPLTNKKYFKIYSAETGIPGLLLAGDYIYPGIDGVVASGLQAARASENYLKVQS